MTTRTPIFIVCSLSGRVGKTTTARLLGDYFIASRRTFSGFDTDAHEPRFAQRFPNEVAIAVLNSIQGQMALIDPLLNNDSVPKIIDLWHRALDPFFALVDHTGFVAEARGRGVEPIILYLDDGSARASSVAKRLNERYPTIQLVVVQNDAINPESVDHAPQTALTFRIGKLDPTLHATIDEPTFSISRFVVTPPPEMSIVVRAALRDWIGRVFSQFKSFELRMTLSETEHF